MTTSAPTVAPCSNPMMSGEPSGLRVSDWKIAPEIPSAAPTSTAHSARGSRSSRTMNSVPGLPPPNSARVTSAGEIGELARADGDDEQREHHRQQEPGDDDGPGVHAQRDVVADADERARGAV